MKYDSKIWNFIVGDEETRKERDNLAHSEGFTYGQLIGLGLIFLALIFFGVSFTTLGIAALIGLMIVRFNF